MRCNVMRLRTRQCCTAFCTALHISHLVYTEMRCANRFDAYCLIEMRLRHLKIMPLRDLLRISEPATDDVSRKMLGQLPLPGRTQILK
jgi:hypothetical protein